VVPYINKTALYKFQWGYKPKGKSSEEYRAWAKGEIDPLFNRLIAQSEAEGILKPQAVYGYFPCQAAGDELIVFNEPEGRTERCRFPFPRQTTERSLCIADFFRPAASGEIDVVAFQLVTVGQHASDFARDLFSRDVYQEYLYWHGMNAEGAEGLAEFIHKRIRAELGFGNEDARAIGDLIADQDKILDLLGAERIGVVMGDESQLWPEDSTSAIVVHHPAAKYFGV
jgi:5-methyltetrahydrofolate--homocysteine methyltransferase